MYEVEHFAQTDVSVLHGYLAEHPFAALVVGTPEGPSVDHLPMELDASLGSKGRLLGHVARANPIWRNFDSGPALAVFSAHHAYVSPDWYPSKSADPRVVPTWNYAAVHVSGRLSFFHDADRIRALLTRLTDQFESKRIRPWRTSDAPPEFLEKMVGGVVGFELEIEQMNGKWKLSQNRSAQDREGVRCGLRREGGVGGAALADLMEEKESGTSVA